jgi:hypothetical protein
VSKDAMLPCLMCGKALLNSFEDSINQPEEGTEFTTYGHYGSTFWDSFEGEELVLNVCDDCLRKHPERLGRQKTFRRVVVHETVAGLQAENVVGREWLHRELVPYFDGPEDEDTVAIEPEEIGVLTGYRIEWIKDWRETKQRLVNQARAEEGRPPCLHTQHLAECKNCGAAPLQGLR